MNADVEKAVERVSRSLHVNCMPSAGVHVDLDDIRQALRDQEAEIARLRGLLHAESVLLRAWARESREGGWSTHQVDPMNRRADEITAHLGAKHE